MKRSLMLLVAALLFLPILMNTMGCGDDSDRIKNAARIRVLHASPDTASVDIYLDDTLQWPDLPYKGGSGYLAVKHGQRNLTVNVADSYQTLVEDTVFLAENTPYTYLTVNYLADIESLLLQDDNTAPDTGYAKLRFVHASPSESGLDVYITTPDYPLQYVDPQVEDLNFKVSTPFLEIPEGEHQIRVTLPGDTELIPIYDSGPVTLDDNSILTFVVVNATGGSSPISLVVLTDDKRNPVDEITDIRSQVRVVHTSPDTSFVNVLLDDTDFVTFLYFKQASDYEEVDAGSSNIAVNEVLGPDLIDETICVERGRNYSYFMVNFKQDIESMLLPDDYTAPLPYQAKVRFIHASPDAPDVDILVDGTVEISYLPFKGVTDYVEFWEGERDFQVNEAGTGTALIDDTTETLEAGKVYTFIVVGELEHIDEVLLSDN